MHRTTDNQLIHRQYLQSPIWKAKRMEAIRYYGAVCSRCKGHGTDVHHKTYKRVGGAEIMADLEIMCRGCHEAHHRIERACKTKTKRRNKGISRMALASYLTPKQRNILREKLKLSWGELYCAILSGKKPAVSLALEMAGKKYAYLSKGRGKKSAPRGYEKHYSKMMS